MLCKRAANSNTHDGSMVLVDMLTWMGYIDGKIW
jgi:hypothetical protein